MRALIALVCVFAASAAAHAAPTSIPAFTLSADPAPAPANTSIPEIVGLDYPNNGVTAAATGTTLTLTAGAGQWTGSVITRAYNWHTVNAPTVSLGSGSTLTIDVSATPAVAGQAIELDETVNGLTGSTTQTSHWFGPIETSAPAAPIAMELSLPPTGPQPLPVSPAHFLQCYGPGTSQHAIFPGGAIPPCAPNTDPAHVWYFDPINGLSQAAMTTAGVPTASQGHAGHPFKDTYALFLAATGNGYTQKLWGNVILPGDTIYQEPGDPTHPIGDIYSSSPAYSTSDRTTSGAIAFTWILPAPDAASRPLLHRVGFNNGAAGFLVRGFTVEQYRENNNNPISAGGGDTHDLVFEDMHVCEWKGHCDDPWLPSHYPNSGGTSNGDATTASPTFAYGVEDPTTTIATAPANSTTTTMATAPPAWLVGMYIWSPGYYAPSPVVSPGASGIPNGSKVISISGNVVTIGACDPVADHKTGCPSTPPPGCDPKVSTVINQVQTFSGGCPAGTTPPWNGTTRALNGEKVFYTAAMTIVPAGYWNHVDFDGAGASGFRIAGGLDRAHSIDPTHPNLLINAYHISIKDSIVRDTFNGYAMADVHDSILYNDKCKWASGDCYDAYSDNRLWFARVYGSDWTVLWAHQDGIQFGDANGRGENPAGTDAFYGNAVIESEFYAQTDPTNPFPRPMQGINTTEHEHYFMYVADNVVSVSSSGGGIGIAGHYDVVAHNTVFGLATKVGHQPKGTDLSPTYSMLANNVGNGVSRDASIHSYCDPVLGDMDIVEGNVSLPFVPLAGASSVYCTTNHAAGSGASAGTRMGLSVWTQTDWRSGGVGSSPFTAYQPMGAPVEPAPGWVTPPSSPIMTPCVQNSFPNAGGCGPTVAGSNNVRPNPAFAGAPLPITLGSPGEVWNLPLATVAGQTYYAQNTACWSGAVAPFCNAGVYRATATTTLANNSIANLKSAYTYLGPAFNPGIIGAGTNLGPQQPIADHAGKAWANPPSIGAYEAN